MTPHADAPCPSHIDRSPAFTPPTSVHANGAAQALARSPLITHNRSPLGNQASPYVQRPRDGPGGGGPMLGGSSDLRQNLIVSSTEQGRRFSG